MPASWRLLPAAAILVVLVASHAEGQQRPLPTEMPEGVGSGNAGLQAGVDYARDQRFTLSGLTGNLWRLALLRIDVGLSDFADVDLSGGLRDHLAITSTTPAVLSGALRLTDPTSTSDFDDIIIGTKIRLLAKQAQRPALAVRLATRLPNAKHQSGLGQDTTDFFATAIIGQSIGEIRIVGNFGIGVLGDPLNGHRRVNSFLYNALVTRGLGARVDAIAAIDGRTGPDEPGLESRAIARAGVARRLGVARVEADLTLGVTRRDGNVGFALQTSFVFHTFNP